jgi:hypothetical protein
MKITELLEHRMIFRRKPKSSGMDISWRCTTGPRKNKTVKSLTQCSAPLNPEKITKMKNTRKKTSKVQSRKTKLTKKIDPVSKLVTKINKQKAKPKQNS